MRLLRGRPYGDRMYYRKMICRISARESQGQLGRITKTYYVKDPKFPLEKKPTWLMLQVELENGKIIDSVPAVNATPLYRDPDYIRNLTQSRFFSEIIWREYALGIKIVIPKEPFAEITGHTESLVVGYPAIINPKDGLLAIKATAFRRELMRAKSVLIEAAPEEIEIISAGDLEARALALVYHVTTMTASDLEAAIQGEGEVAPFYASSWRDIEKNVVYRTVLDSLVAESHAVLLGSDAIWRNEKDQIRQRWKRVVERASNLSFPDQLGMGEREWLETALTSVVASIATHGWGERGLSFLVLDRNQDNLVQLDIRNPFRTFIPSEGNRVNGIVESSSAPSE